jgi:hypothetical protein
MQSGGKSVFSDSFRSNGKSSNNNVDMYNTEAFVKQSLIGTHVDYIMLFTFFGPQYLDRF